MLHASMRAIGNIPGGPDQVHQAIMRVIQPGGSLMIYVGGEPEYEAVGRNKLSPEEEQDLLQNCPAFDPQTARARRDYGILAEFFRSWPGVVCSRNPGARMAALGDKAAWLTGDQPLNYGYGPGSPLAKLCENQGKLLLLGSDLDQTTLLHYAEHLAPLDGKRIKRFKVPLLQKNQRVWQDIEEYDTSIGIKPWPERFFASIVEQFLKQQGLHPKKVGRADSYLLEAKSLVDFAQPLFISTASTL
jgi:aminoglycoside 3-N-acetyltransferase